MDSNIDLQAWDSDIPLQHEPFRSRFALWDQYLSEVHETRRGSSSANNQSLYRTLRRDTRNDLTFRRRFLQWIKTILGYEPHENEEALNLKNFRHKTELWTLYLDFYWLLHKGDVERAQELVHSFRRAQGFDYLLLDNAIRPLTPEDLECIQIGDYTEDENEDGAPLVLRVNKRKPQRRTATETRQPRKCANIVTEPSTPVTAATSHVSEAKEGLINTKPKRQKKKSAQKPKDKKVLESIIVGNKQGDSLADTNGRNADAIQTISCPEPTYVSSDSRSRRKKRKDTQPSTVLPQYKPKTIHEPYENPEMLPRTVSNPQPKNNTDSFRVARMNGASVGYLQSQEIGHTHSHMLLPPLSVSTRDVGRSEDIRTSGSEKQPLPPDCKPLYWASSRQALCESTTWFRAYHGGVYFSESKAYGYLLGGFSAQRDVFKHNGRLIISHGGGKVIEDIDGRIEGHYSVDALLESYKMEHPIILVIDAGYSLFPYDIGQCMYAVLGLYWIVDTWAEREHGGLEGEGVKRVTYKFAFQYCEEQGDPWWLGKSSLSSSATRNLTQKTSCAGGWKAAMRKNTYQNRRCNVCKQASPNVYYGQWTCLQPNCTRFFDFKAEDWGNLEYMPTFLELRTGYELPLTNYQVKALSPFLREYYPKGWGCVECGQLCVREEWRGRECTNCRTAICDTLPIKSHRDFLDQEALFVGSKGKQYYKIYDWSGITVKFSVLRIQGDAGALLTFQLPENRGCIHLMRGNAKQTRRANKLFCDYQKEALQNAFLRRYSLKTRAKGRMLANYFSQNSGVPYKYVVGTNDTVPFDKAPACVKEALALITERASAINPDAEFNEILTAAYMEQQSMSYHTDDEKGLQPIVSSLSLGSMAQMHFRLREKYRREEQMEEHNSRELTLVLRHGDVLMMDGADIQRCYEHTVVPLNLRIAATARKII